MKPWLEIIVPVRNPGDKLLETGASLVAQTERGFGVVVSDNFSTSGAEFVEEFSRMLAAAEIPVRRVRPPFELGRVQHWNWAHAQGEADWLKPLFTGDLLLPRYVEKLRERLVKNPAAQIVRCEFEQRTPTGNFPAARAPFSNLRLSSAQFLEFFPLLGNWLGGPINIAYARTAWQASGGYAVQLPACADLQLSALLALQHGLEVLHEPLAVFQLHGQRFSSGIRGRRVIGCVELWLILRQLKNFCATRDLPWPDFGVARGVARQARLDYWQPFAVAVKAKLGRHHA
jgi:hypothetical protein